MLKRGDILVHRLTGERFMYDYKLEKEIAVTDKTYNRRYFMPYMLKEKKSSKKGERKH